MSFTSDYLAPSGGIHLCAITPDTPEITGKWFGSDHAAADAWASAQNALGRNIYWTVGITTPGLDKKPSKPDIVGFRCAHVDIDPPRDNPAWNKQNALSDLLSRPQPPSVVIDSGNGLQALWWMEQGTVTDTPTLELINSGIRNAFLGSDSCQNVDRLLRLPGTINYPNAKKRSIGRTAVRSELVVPFTGATYSVDSLRARFPFVALPETLLELTAGPCAEYTGPESDDELIRMILASKGGMNALFGGKATVVDLWKGDATVLANHFQSHSGGDFDHSAADAALFAHLAFWAGKDAARMDRLFRRSALMREKYEKRQDYRTDTIRKAVSGCRSVYNMPRRETPAPAAPAEELLTTVEQLTYFKGCTYVLSEHKILVPDGEMLKPDQFKAYYGGHVFSMSADSTGPTKNAWEAFTENRAVRFPKVVGTVFEPKKPFGHIEDKKVNIYIPDPRVNPVKGDVSLMLRHVAKAYPDERDQEILWTWFASLIQNPGIKFQWAVFLQGTQGSGKSVWGEILKRAIGPKFYHKPNAEDINNKFNDFMDFKLLIDVQEITLENKYEVMENLKEWITADEVEMQPKGGKKAMRPNKANWMIASNWRAALPIDKNERRIAPFFAKQQSAEDLLRDGMFGTSYFPDMWDWLRGGGFNHMTHYLQNRPLSVEFDPAGRGAAAARAPMTTSRVEAQNLSLSRAEQEVLEAIDSEMVGFRNGWISSVALTKLFADRRISMSQNKVGPMLEALNFRNVGRSSRIVMEDEGKRPILYVHRSLYNPELGVDNYCISQGYSITGPNMRGISV